MKQIGLISDTHGLLREEAVQALKGADLIIHAGDIGDIEVINKLREIAPTVAVRGNCDRDEWAKNFEETEIVEVEEILIYVLHDVKQLDADPKESGINIVISGHSHIPKEEIKDEVLYINPGSAGPRRFNLPIGLARLKIEKGEVEVELVRL